jgi:hypothetical protein
VYWSLVERTAVLERVHSFLSLLLRILALHPDCTLLFLLQISDEVRVMRIRDCPARLCHLACRRSLL